MSKPIRILHVLQRMEAGGTQTFLMNLYREIDKSKIQFDFLTEYPTKQFYDDEIESLGGKVYRSTVRLDGNILKFENKLRNILTENQYSIIHVHAYTIGFFCLKIAKQCGVPIRIAHSHNNQMTKGLFYPAKIIMRKLYPIYANYFMACSEDAGKFLFPKKDFIVVKNAIDTNKFKFNQSIRQQTRQELQISDKFVVGNVGRLHKQKNQIFLLDIFKYISEYRPNAKLLMVGDGPLRKELLNKANSLGISDKLILLSNQTNMTRLYQAMDVFVLPSLFEGLGIVAIEAQTSGLPTFCSNTVSKDACVSKLFHSLPLGSADTWAQNILKSDSTRKPDEGYTSVKNSGFDVTDNAYRLQKWYIETYLRWR